MSCTTCAKIPAEIAKGFIAQEAFLKAERFANEQVASHIWKAEEPNSGFESVYSCTECGAHFHLLMPDPPASGGLIRVSATQQRINELRAKRQEL